MKDAIVKAVLAALLALCATIGGMVAWYVKVLTDEVASLRGQVTRLSVAVEVQAGGNPFDEED